MNSYDNLRQTYKPQHIKILFIAESPPPSADIASSRQFYRADRVRTGDRLFVNTIKALYPEAENLTEKQLEAQKELWLYKFKQSNLYMIEALEESLPHEVTKQERQALISKNLSRLLTRVKKLAQPDTKVVLIKSNVFEVAAQPLKEAGFVVLNTSLLDYPGQFNQRAYRDKLKKLIKDAHLLQV